MLSGASRLPKQLERTYVEGYREAKTVSIPLNRNISLDDFQDAAYGKSIEKDVLDEIYSIIRAGERRGEYYISDVLMKSLPNEAKGTTLMSIEPIPVGQKSLLRLNINSDVISGRTLTEIHARIACTSSNIAHDLGEATIHETGHARLISGKEYQRNRITLSGIKR